MKNLIYLGCLALLISGCKGTVNQNDNALTGTIPVKPEKKQVVEATRDYLMATVKNPIVSENSGLYRIQGTGEVYIFDPSGVSIGKLDEDDKDDAVITCTYESTGNDITKRLLILMNKDSLTVVTALTSDLSVLKISDKILYVERSTAPEDDPGVVPCSACVDTLRYRMVSDSLIELE